MNLRHTGGNYYADGFGKAFSSTLVYTENDDLTVLEVQEEMQRFLGVKDYITSKLAPKITIEHFDTFGKLVAPDTIIWAHFPKGSRYKEDSERFLAKIKKLRTPYGTKYKLSLIHI